MEDSKARSIEQISSLLASAGKAHHHYEEETGQTDPDWPGWYATYLLDHGVVDLLREALTQAKLRELLVRADESHRATSPSTPWPDYYAGFLLGNVNGEIL